MNDSKHNPVKNTPRRRLLALICMGAIWGGIQAHAANPVIYAQPADQSVPAGMRVSFSVLADGTPPLAFHWFKDGVPLANQSRYVAQDTNLNISAVAVSDSGRYTVVVSNNAREAGSALASLMVHPELPVLRLGGVPSLYYASGVAVSGALACMADGDAGLQMISLTNPASPVWLGSFNIGDWANGVAVAGDVACVAAGGSGLQVISISNPASPVRLGGYVTSGNAFGVAIDGALAFVAVGAAGLQIISLTNPTNPILLGGLDTDGWAIGVAVVGAVAYVADGDAGLQMISVSNPASPVWLGGYDTGGYTYGVAVANNVAYVADYNGGLQVIDVGNPASPVWLGGYDTGGFACGVAVANNLAYVASYDAGLQVFDVSTPTHLLRLGGCDTLGQASSVVSAGGVICVADGEAGLVTFALGTNSNMVPVLLSQPQAQTVSAGGSTVLGIAANGTPPLSYQWHFGNSPLPGATNSLLWLTNLQPSQAGSYSLTVSNQTGGVLSDPALVTVLFANASPPVVQGGAIRFDLSSVAGKTVEVLSSVNLADWTVLATFTNLAGPIPFNVPMTNGSRCFYRLRVLP